MGSIHHTDHREAAQLKLTKQHFPFPCTLQPLVLQRYADPTRSAAPGLEMDTGELLAYLRNIGDDGKTPLDAVLAQTDAVGDPGLPTPAQVASLRWLGDSWQTWLGGYPLEEPLAGELRRLLPLLAIAAVTDLDFHTPGEHALHQVLDALQEAAVGWHPQLERAGQVVNKLVTTAVADCLATLEGGIVSPEQVAEEVLKAAERNAQRVARMTQRLTENEQGRVRSLRARQQAAAMLNPLLLRFPAPQVLGVFVRGAWFESAQLVWLKFGETSNQWHEVCQVSESLLQSVQNLAAGDEKEREARMQMVAVLPEQLRRWTLSLQNDTGPLEDLLSHLEFEHLRLLGYQQLELTEIPLIETENADHSEADDELPVGIVEGQWYRVTEKKTSQRLRLISRQPESGDLLFVNVAGLKARTLPVAQFSALLAAGAALPLQAGVSFSGCLATAAGIDSPAALATLTGGLATDQSAPCAETPPPDPEPETAPRAATAAPVHNPIPELPTGTWMGFHDGESPLLAKLAMHDRQRGLYIFVNREGIKLRQLQQDEFLQLIERGLVDIMESRVNFRELVSRKQHQLSD